MKLLTDGLINKEQALKNSTNRHEFELRLKGVQSASDKSWEQFEGAESGGESPGEL
jgi:hypothetical protein